MRSISRVWSFVLVLAASIAAYAPTSARAEADPSGFVGGLFGLAVPSLSGTNARMEWGLTAGAKIGSEIGVAGYYLTNSKDEGGSVGTFGVDLYGVQASYHFEGEAKGAFFGARLGLSKVTQSVSGSSFSTSPYHWGVVGGYDYFLGESLSLGAEASFISVGQADATVSGASIKSDAFNVLSFLAAVKFWF